MSSGVDAGAQQQQASVQQTEQSMKEEEEEEESEEEEEEEDRVSFVLQSSSSSSQPYNANAPIHIKPKPAASKWGSQPTGSPQPASSAAGVATAAPTASPGAPTPSRSTAPSTSSSSQRHPFALPFPNEAVYEMELESVLDKPWRRPGADLTDWFNYGFDEETWKFYCQKQIEQRMKSKQLAKSKPSKKNEEDAPAHKVQTYGEDEDMGTSSLPPPPSKPSMPLPPPPMPAPGRLPAPPMMMQPGQGTSGEGMC